MRLLEIDFPVYRLKKAAPIKEDDVYYYITERFNLDTGEYMSSVKILDDTSISAETLGLRRLKLKSLGVPLYPLSISVYYLGDFIKANKTPRYWIDSKGKVFNYTKSIKAKLKHYPIKKIIFPDATGAIVELEGLPQRFRTLFKPTTRVEYGQVLEFSNIKVLCGLVKNNAPPTWRLI